MSNPCAPVNPCDCAETADIREQGPPGARGLPGGIPVFQIGSTISGPVPLVTVTMVNPLLYTLDFVIPTVGTDLPNTWTGIQTFEPQAIFNNGLAASGSSTFVDLTTSGALTSNGTFRTTGLSTFDGNTVFNGTNDFQGDTTFVNAEVDGAFKLPNILLLSAGVGIKGTVVVQADGTLAFVVGGSANSASGSTALAATIAFNASEAAIAFNLPFVVPAGPDASCAIVVQLSLKPTVNPPVDWSVFLVRVRLDNATVGTVVGSTGVTDYEGTAQINALFTIPAGAHTLYFTIQGLGDGSSSVDLTFISARIVF